MNCLQPIPNSCSIAANFSWAATRSVRALGAPDPDLSRYDALIGNLPLLGVSAIGAMFTGAFIEEVLYWGFLIDRLERLFAAWRYAAVLAARRNPWPLIAAHALLDLILMLQAYFGMLS